MNDIVISLKPEFINLILKQEKNYEFRKYLPKKGVNKIWVYSKLPVARLEYLIIIDKIITYPEKILEPGLGNEEFNNGLKSTKYAYHIKHLYRMKEGINLKVLKEKYNFIAPQSYFYLENNLKLKNYLLSEKLEQIF